MHGTRAKGRLSAWRTTQCPYGPGPAAPADPARGRRAAALTVTVRSTTDTSLVGTRKAMPVSLPLSSGSTLPTALAAPVDEGMMLPFTARPPRQSFLEGPSTVFCVAVLACTVVMRPSLMPNFWFTTCGGGGRAHRPISLAAQPQMQPKRQRRPSHLGQRRQAVGGARGVGDDVVLGGVVLLVVHAHHEHGRVRRGRGDDDLLGARVDVRRGLRVRTSATRAQQPRTRGTSAPAGNQACAAWM
jgi:hypothetical protein